MTITSFTDENKTYETTPEHCSCPDHQYRHHACKHMNALIHELNRAQKFLLLKTLFDVRNRPQRQFTYIEDGQLHTARRVDWAAILD